MGTYSAYARSVRSDRSAVSVIHPDEGAVVVKVEGSCDIFTKPPLIDTLVALIPNNELVVVDVSEAEFIDSSFIHGLFAGDKLSKERGTKMAVRIGEAAIVLRALEITGMLDVLEIIDS